MGASPLNGKKNKEKKTTKIGENVEKAIEQLTPIDRKQQRLKQLDESKQNKINFLMRTQN